MNRQAPLINLSCLDWLLISPKAGIMFRVNGSQYWVLASYKTPVKVHSWSTSFNLPPPPPRQDLKLGQGRERE